MHIVEKQIEDNENVKEVTMRYVGMRDDEYTYDRCTYKETKICNFESGDSMNAWKFKQELISNEPHYFAQISAFAINTPYIAFSGLEDYLVTFNMNSPDYIHRIQLLPHIEGDRGSIKQTQITETNDLLAIINIGTVYKLFLIDLNAYDLTSFEELKVNPDSLFYEGQRTPILEYSDNEVKGQPLIKMHCRGSSHKQAIDFD